MRPLSLHLVRATAPAVTHVNKRKAYEKIVLQQEPSDTKTQSPNWVSVFRLRFDNRQGTAVQKCDRTEVTSQMQRRGTQPGPSTVRTFLRTLLPPKTSAEGFVAPCQTAWSKEFIYMGNWRDREVKVWVVLGRSPSFSNQRAEFQPVGGSGRGARAETGEQEDGTDLLRSPFRKSTQPATGPSLGRSVWSPRQDYSDWRG